MKRLEENKKLLEIEFKRQKIRRGKIKKTNVPEQRRTPRTISH